ncbi:MAG: UvrD-helicase domain-containing protein [Turneriella sp.]|nr:UvrD-helicase domain-containing protein [Turneriella sp.]
MPYTLNAQQRSCVEHGSGPLLVLAGAGSGKTGVITQRIAHLVRSGIPGHAICAVTFTNKAAQEMRERVREILGKNPRGMFLGTFHSLGLKILRDNAHRCGLVPQFSVLARDDQLALAREILVAAGVDLDAFSEKFLLSLISDCKNSGRSPKEFFADFLYPALPAGLSLETLMANYGERLKAMQAVDFDDLILLPERLLAEDVELQRQYQQKLRWFLVDEFQDTNPLQFRFLLHLLAEPFNLCAVGDDDQAIYSWRGADASIMLGFRRHFPQAKIIALEQNYRSRQFILDLANALIAHNRHRHSKNLFSLDTRPGQAVVFSAQDSLAEAERIAEAIITTKLRDKKQYSDFCVLYRTNFQSRPFEEVFRQRNLPYRVSGSYDFYERSEIKDVLAYLRFFANPADDRALLRILNLPRRGISEKACERLVQYALQHKMSLWSAVEQVELAEIGISAVALGGLLAFKEFVAKHRNNFFQRGGLARATQNLVADLQLQEEYRRQGHDPEKVTNKMLNIRELIRAIEDFEDPERAVAVIPEETERNIYSYLQFIALLSREQGAEQDTLPRVQLMTIHQAKGLEFDTVFIAGLEEGLLPHHRSTHTEDDLTGLEEERRLFYVAITRARERLFLSYAATRRSHGQIMETSPSRFLSELPPHLLDWEQEKPADLGELEKMLAQLDQSRR